MDIELIESIDLNDEFEKYYFSNESYNKVSRRDFMRFFTVGSAGLILPMSSSEANPLLWFIRAMVSVISLATSFLFSEEPSKGDIYLINDNSIKVRGNLEIALHKNSNNNILSSKISNYTVPPNKVQKYRFSNGPAASINNDIEAYLSARSRIDKRNSDLFVIKS